jgi:predicted nucleic acid-binding protein
MDKGRKRVTLADWLSRDMLSMDGLVAATAIAHDLTLARRNTKDFEGFGIALIDPWLA